MLDKSNEIDWDKLIEYTKKKLSRAKVKTDFEVIEDVAKEFSGKTHLTINPDAHFVFTWEIEKRLEQDKNSGYNQKPIVKDHSYLRARLSILEQLRKSVKDEQMLNYIYSGYIHPDLYSSAFSSEEEYVRHEMHSLDLDNSPLSFTEITSGSTWFALHPEKICGIEEPTTSLHFPVSVKGGKEDVIKTIENSIQASKKEGKTDDLAVKRIKAKAMKLKLDLLKMERERKHKGTSGLPNYALSGVGLSGVDFLSGLGALNGDTESKVDAITASEILEKTKQDGNSKKKKQSFEEVFEMYNKGISKEEIQAWVWYKRSLGYPMEHWKKYWIGSSTGDASTYVVAKQGTTLLDNRWQPVQKVPAGAIIGKPTKFEKEYRGIVHLIIVAQDGRKFIVNKAEVRIEKTAQKVSQSELDALVKKNALFYLAGELLPYPVYAFGNMYERENQLEEDKESIIGSYGQDVYKAHQEVIQKGKPNVISIQNPDRNERPKILVFSEFAVNFFITQLKEETNVELQVKEEEGMNLQEAFKIWLDTLERHELGNLSSYQIRHFYVNNANMRGLSDEEKAMINRYAPQEGEEHFARFLHEALAFDDQVKLDRMWNEVYNGWSDIPYTRVPVGFECSAGFKMSNKLEFTQPQREAIAFMEIAGSGIIAYDVGVGKTLSSIISVANAIYSGKTKRPLIVVPNPTYGKWLADIMGLYDKKGRLLEPGCLAHTGITINEWYNLGTKILPKLNLEQAVPENSITLMTYEGFTKIGFSERVMSELFEELNEILKQQGEDITVRAGKKKELTLDELIGVGLADTVADIDTLGFDYLVIDEAHNFKNIFMNRTKDQDGNKRFRISGGASQQGMKCFFLANFIQRKFGRNVMLLTATPFTNSPIEIYSMLSLVAINKLAGMGIKNLETFMETFILQSLEYVNSYDGGIKESYVVKRFNNRLILQKLIHNHIAYKTGEDAGVIRPCKINLPRLYKRDENGVAKRLPVEKQILTYLEMNEDQREHQAKIIRLAQDKSKMSNIFRAMAMSLDNALSPYLFKFSEPPEDHVEFVENSPKILYTVECIKSVKEYHEQRNEPVSGQVIYMNRGKEFFPFIKRYLIEEVGYKEGVKDENKTFDEVEIISSGISATRKEGIKDAFLKGVVKVILGTATIKEGIDLQKYGTVLYNCYADYNPTDLKQVEGRIHRQGNTFGYVRVAMPLVQDSMDVFVFQKLEEKTARINDIWYRSDRGNVLDQETLDPEEVKFALYTDMRMLAAIEIDKEKKETDRRLSIAQDNYGLMTELQHTVQEFYGQRQRLREMLSNTNTTLISQVLTESGLLTRSYDWLHVKDDKQKKAFLDRVKALTEETVEFLHSSAMDDKDLIRIARKHMNIFSDIDQRRTQWDYERLISDFKVNLSKVRKAERTTLAQKGYTLDSDFEVVKAEYKDEMERIKHEKEQILSEAYFMEKLEEVEQKKKRLAIKGGTAEERVTDFASLNHLLSIPFADKQPETCDLPTIDQASVKKPSSNKADKVKIVKLRAKAIKVKLELLKQQREREELVSA